MPLPVWVIPMSVKPLRGPADLAEDKRQDYQFSSRLRREWSLLEEKDTSGQAGSSAGDIYNGHQLAFKEILRAP